MKHLLFFALFLSGTGAFAQQNLLNWIRECEKDPAVDITVIDQKFPDTRKRDCYVVRVILKDRPQLLEGMKKAFEKDKGEAVSVSQARRNGEVLPERSVFRKTETDKSVTEILFDFFYDTKKNRTEATMIQTFDRDNPSLEKKRTKYLFGG